VTGALEPRRFYAECVPAHFNRVLEEQEAKGEAGRRLYEDMRAVDATIRIEVEGEGGGTFYLNIAEGRMRASEEASHPPFLTLLQDRRAFERLVCETGDSAAALLGGLAGLGGAMQLTRSRIEQLAGLSGLMHFEVTGDDGFALRTHFGSDPIPGEADTRIRMDEAAYRGLRSGELDLQSAFMNLRIVIEGDLQLAMQVALATVAAD
jgi:hypothetical protein